MLRCCYVTGHGWGGGDINVHVPCLHTWMLRCCYVTGHGWGGGDINVHVPCLHTWMLRCCYVTGHGWGGGDINVHVPCLHMWMLHCCYVTGHGWGGGILMFMYLAYIRGCYAAATSLGMGGVGGDINVHVPCLHTWMLRCCYVTGHGWGGGDINVHVPCLHTWMLRCCYVTGHGWGGGDINVHVPCLHTWMLRCCYAAANFWNTWKTSCRRIDAVRWGKKEANPGIDKVVTSFQKKPLKWSFRWGENAILLTFQWNSATKSVYTWNLRNPLTNVQKIKLDDTHSSFWATAVYAPGS